MDVESLAKQLILKNMTPEQQTAVLASIRDSVKQSKEMQKQRIGQNVAVVVEALKKIEADIRARYDEVGNAIETRVANIKDGKDGIDGIDGARGIDGRPGRDGQQGPAGAPGKDGRDGVDGVDGVSVTDAKIDFDGSLVISLSNGREINVGEVVAPDIAEKIRVVANGGGTSQSVIDALASLQTQIDNLIPSQTGNAGKFLTTNGTALSWANLNALTYEGTWNASTNTPTLASSVGQNGHYYVVSTSGSTNLNGITDWVTGDWAIFNGSAWQKIDQTNLVSSVNGEVGAVVLDAADVGAIATITSTDGSVTISTVGTSSDLSVATAGSTTNVLALVRNTTGATLTKGTVVYISGSTGQNPTVSKAIATGDATSAQTLGIMTADLSNNSNGYVTIIGLVSNINTSAFTDGQQLYLSPTTAGTYTATKPYAPDHLVYIGVVERAHPTQGKIFVKVQNGYEMDELHNVSARNATNGQVLIYNETTSLWTKNTLTDGTGISITEGAGSITITNTGVTSVSGTSPIASSGGATPAISLSSGYGDTQNPYASKTANFVLAAPNGTAGVPTFRAVVASDIPTLNQNTTGNAGTVTNGAYVNVANTFTATQTISSANLTFTGTGNRILGDFSNATIANRVMFQTSTVNSGTNISITPNGTISSNSGASHLRLEDSTSIATGNGSFASLLLSQDLDFRIQSTRNGSGTFLPMTFYTGGGERMRLDTSGNLGVGNSAPAVPLDIYNSTISSLRVQGDAVANMQLARFSTDTTPAVSIIRKGRGTVASPAAVASGDIMGQFIFSAFGGTNNSNLAAISGVVETYTSDTNISSNLQFSTSPTGSVTAAERMRIDSVGNVRVTSAAGLGYGTGSGGTVTQATSKATAVTLNKPTGQITMNNAALAAGATVAFTLNNSLLSATDLLLIQASGDTPTSNQNYSIRVYPYNTGAAIYVKNESAGSLSDAVLLKFAIIKGAIT